MAKLNLEYFHALLDIVKFHHFYHHKYYRFGCHIWLLLVLSDVKLHFSKVHHAVKNEFFSRPRLLTSVIFSYFWIWTFLPYVDISPSQICSLCEFCAVCISNGRYQQTVVIYPFNRFPSIHSGLSEIWFGFTNSFLIKLNILPHFILLESCRHLFMIWALRTFAGTIRCQGYRLFPLPRIAGEANWE